MKSVLNCLVMTLVVFVLFGCDKESSQNGSKQLDIVTGINYRGTDGSDQGTAGNPNSFNNEVSIFPNPLISDGVAFATSNSPIESYYIIAAEAKNEFQTTDFSTQLNSSTHSSASIQSAAIFSEDEVNSNPVRLDFTSYANGYYRVFVEIDGQFYWENVVKLDSFGGPNDPQNVWPD